MFIPENCPDICKCNADAGLPRGGYARALTRSTKKTIKQELGVSVLVSAARGFVSLAIAGEDVARRGKQGFNQGGMRFKGSNVVIFAQILMSCAEFTLDALSRVTSGKVRSRMAM